MYYKESRNSLYIKYVLEISTNLKHLDSRLICIMKIWTILLTALYNYGGNKMLSYVLHKYTHQGWKSVIVLGRVYTTEEELDQFFFNLSLVVKKVWIVQTMYVL